jgi:hypothetical protein
MIWATGGICFVLGALVGAVVVGQLAIKHMSTAVQVMAYFEAKANRAEQGAARPHYDA